MFAVLPAAAPAPWFPSWNYALLKTFFSALPHTKLSLAIAYVFVRNPITSVWVFAAAFFYYWRVQDAETALRRRRLVAVAISCIAAVLATGLFRPWVGWPAPTRSPDFHVLYPVALWGAGTRNCFPSHSTLVYLTVAMGMLEFNRRLGVFLIGFTFLTVSMPRIYVGGHYPIDVVASAVLAGVVYLGVRGISQHPLVANVLTTAASSSRWTDLLLLLWLCELGEGFRATETTASEVLRVVRHFIG